METCFGMNRPAILALSISLVCLQAALCGEMRGKCFLYSHDAFQVRIFPTINCLNSLLIRVPGISERTVLCCGYDRDGTLVFDLVP